MPLGNDREQRLNQLFTDYKAACPDAEGGANFVPMLWQRIEARRSPVLQWVTLSRRALVGAAAICMVLGLVMTSAFTSSQFYQTTYVEALDDNEVPEDLAAMHPVSIESTGAAADRR